MRSDDDRHLGPPAQAALAAADAAATGPARSSPAASRSPAAPSAATSSACASSATRSTRSPARPAATGCTPAPRCRRCCSTTTRRSRSPSACAPPPRASVTGIEETSVRALVKLEQVLPSHLRRRVNALQTATVTLRHQRRPDGRPRGADRDRRRLPRPRAAALRLSRPRRRPRRSRVVEPHTLVNLGRRWYLVAWDCDREDWRTFRVDRLTRLAPAGARFEPRALPDDDAGGLRGGEPVGRAVALPGPRHPASRRPSEVAERALFAGSTVEADRRAHVRAAHERRLAGLAGGARGACSASTSRSTSRPSSSSASASWRRASSGRRAGARSLLALAPSPAAGGGRVLSADHAPQTPQAPSEDVSAATRPRTVLARPGASAASRSASVYSFAAAAPAPGRRAAALRRVSRHRGLAPRWRANGALVSLASPCEPSLASVVRAGDLRLA